MKENLSDLANMIDEDFDHATQNLLKEAGGRFQPDQPDDEIALIRGGYQRLIGELQNRKRELAMPENDRLVEMLAEATDLMGKVGNTKDFSLDARFFAATAQLGAERIRTEPTEGCEFTVENLMGLMRDIQFKTAATERPGETVASIGLKTWSALGREVRRSWRGALIIDHMLGPFSFEQRRQINPQDQDLNPRKRGERRQREVAPVVEAKALDEATIAEQREKLNETTKNVMQVHECLQDLGEAVPLFRFIIHPTKFDRSVENLFYVAFLISNGHARLYHDNKDEEIMLECVDDEEREEKGGSDMSTVKHQHIFTLTMTKWRQMIQRYQLRKPMIDL